MHHDAKQRQLLGQARGSSCCCAASVALQVRVGAASQEAARQAAAVLGQRLGAIFAAQNKGSCLPAAPTAGQGPPRSCLAVAACGAVACNLSTTLVACRCAASDAQWPDIQAEASMKRAFACPARSAAAAGGGRGRLLGCVPGWQRAGCVRVPAGRRQLQPGGFRVPGGAAADQGTAVLQGGRPDIISLFTSCYPSE